MSLLNSGEQRYVKATNNNNNNNSLQTYIFDPAILKIFYNFFIDKKILNKNDC